MGCWVKLDLPGALWVFGATGLKMGSANTVGPPLTKPLAGEKGAAKLGRGGATPYDEKGEYGVGCGWNIALVGCFLPALYKRRAGELVVKLGEACLLGGRLLLLAPTTSLASEVAGDFCLWAAPSPGQPLSPAAVSSIFRATRCHPSDEGSSPGQTAAANRARRILPLTVGPTSRPSPSQQSTCGGALGAGAVLWLVGTGVWTLEMSPEVLWLHMLPVAADSWMLDAGSLSWVLALASTSPATIGDPQNK